MRVAQLDGIVAAKEKAYKDLADGDEGALDQLERFTKMEIAKLVEDRKALDAEYEKKAGLLAFVQRAKAIKAGEPVEPLNINTINGRHCLRFHGGMDDVRPPSMDVAFKETAALVDKWELSFGYFTPERVDSVANIVYDIAEALGHTLTVHDLNELHALAFPLDAKVTLELHNQNGPDSAQGGKVFRVAMNHAARRIDLLVAIHGLFQEAMLHCQERLFVSLHELKKTGDNSATWTVGYER